MSVKKKTKKNFFFESSNSLDLTPSRSFQHLSATYFDRGDDQGGGTEEDILPSAPLPGNWLPLSGDNCFNLYHDDKFRRNRQSRVSRSALCKHRKPRAALCEKPQLLPLCVFAIKCDRKYTEQKSPPFIAFKSIFFLYK